MDLADMSRADLLTEVGSLGIKGVRDKNMDVIRDAIAVHRAKAVTEADQGRPVEGEDSQPQSTDALLGDPLTGEQRKGLREESQEEIEQALADPKLPVHWRKEFQLELDARREKARKEVIRVRMTSALNKYKITKGGPFVFNGRITRLHTGGVIIDTTHDLKEVARQGIEFESLKGTVEIVEGVLGRTTTRIVED